MTIILPPILILLLIICLILAIILLHLILQKRGSLLNQNNHKAKTIKFDITSDKVISSLWKVNKAVLSSAVNFDKLAEEVVNVILRELNYLQIGYRISVLTLIDRKEGIIRRISFSPTTEALEILKNANVKFHEIKIPLTVKENLLVRSVEDQKTYITHDLSDVFYPEKDRETWRYLQRQVSIKTTLVFPLIIRKESIGAMIFSLSKNEKEITNYEKCILGGFTDAVAVALENANLYSQLENANQKLKDLDKQKDEFISVAAHELRAPMTAIKGYLSMVVEQNIDRISPQAAEFLKGSIEANDRLIRLVNNMLNVARIEEGRLVYQMGKVRLSEVAKTIYEEYKLIAENKGLKLLLNIESGISDEVFVDQDRIHEVVSNLVSNAVKYTDSGSVNIKLSNRENIIIRMEINDTGLGISDAEKKKLFEKFFRAESSIGKETGTGLGLYISKLLIEKFGGKIGVDSQTGKGSTFWFELPIISNP